MKKISIVKHPAEVEITRYFSSEPLASHPRNHCVPLYDVLEPPDDSELLIIVLPFLRDYDSPRFKSIGEAVEFFRQVFEVSTCEKFDMDRLVYVSYSGPTLYAPMQCRSSV